MNLDRPDLQAALKSGDPVALAQQATAEELEKIKVAEGVLEARRQRLRFGSRWQLASQVLVGYVALLGLGVNAFQSWSNKQQQQQQQRLDQERWNKEFDRAQQADKYRAFFETSILATDPSNSDKRLVGYALLEEFVSDPAYTTKASLMLEESLVQELRRPDHESVDAQHQAAIEAIIGALSHAPDCMSIERATRTVERIAQHKTETRHTDEVTRLFGLYVRRMVGRAAQLCPSMREFHFVKGPIEESLVKMPELGGYPGSISGPEANERVAQLLRADCLQEIAVSGTTDCLDILKKYVHLCSSASPPSEEERGCQAILAAGAELGLPMN
jgi:hypothetical protein